MKPNTDNPSLASCIMPTYNRRAFVSKAIAYFLRQDYDDKELSIIDDSTDSVSDLVPANAHIAISA
jgi:glycosyltransferase involved in cell wall biosynthesis